MAKKTKDEPARLETLTDFITAFAAYSASSSDLKCFRGQCDSAWPNVAGLFRSGLEGLYKNENRAVRDLISVHPNEFAPDDTMFDRLVRMQHYGLPTRLLDVSLNALVALYFATEIENAGEGLPDGIVTGFAIPPSREKYYDSDSVSCLANLANLTAKEKGRIDQLRKRLRGPSDNKKISEFNGDSVIKRLIQFIRAEKPYFEPLIDPVDFANSYYVHPKMSNRRILAQSGAFILYGFKPPTSSRRPFIPHPIDEKTFIVPGSAKESIRAELERLGISESTLFPEIDKAAARIKKKQWPST